MKNKSENCPGNRIRQSGYPSGESPADADTNIDERHDTQITRQIMFDIVHDLNRPQARFTLVKKSDHYPAQLRAPEQHEKQRAEKNKNLADRRRNNKKCRLNESHDVDAQTALLIGREKRVAQILQSG